MPFPPAQRVIYRQNPLDQVICQLRFPPILRIDASLPVDFQDSIREDFPNFSEASEYKIDVPAFPGDQLPTELVKQVIQASGIRNYEFSSGDGLLKINLTRTFLALTDMRYERWENFLDRLKGPLQALRETYGPAYFSRIGLRYIDVIKRSAVNLVGVPWRDLLSPALIGMLGSPDIAGSVDKLEIAQEIRLTEQEGTARIIAKLKKLQDGEDVFVIDSDFFITTKTEVNDAISKLNFLNSRSTRLIRWAVSDRLHEALGPQPL